MTEIKVFCKFNKNPPHCYHPAINVVWNGVLSSCDFGHSRLHFHRRRLLHRQLIMSSKRKLGAEEFTRGEVSRDYYKEALHQQENASRSSSPCSSSSTSSSCSVAASTALAASRKALGGAPTCQTCGEKWKFTSSLRDVMRDVKKAQREGYIYCSSCQCSAFQHADIGMGKRVAYCKVCESVLCGACCQKLNRLR